MNDLKLGGKWRPNIGVMHNEPLIAIPHKNVNLLVTYAEDQHEKNSAMWKKMNDRRRREYWVTTALCYLHFMRCEYTMRLAREAVDTLSSRRDIYRQEVKRTCRKIVDEVAKLNMWMYNVIHEEKYLDGYDRFGDIFYGYMSENYGALRYCITQACKPCMTEPALYAQLECLRIVAELTEACRQGDMEKHGNYTYIQGIYAFNAERLIPLLNYLELLIKKRFFIKGSVDVNLNEDEYIRRGVNAITDRFRDGKALLQLLEKNW